MWEIHNNDQWFTFGYSLILGILLSAIYCIFKLDRIVNKRNKIFVAFSDILFFVLSAFLSFNFMLLKTNGQIRGFVLFGIFLGFLIGKIALNKPTVFLGGILKKIKRFFLEKYKKLFNATMIFLKKLPPFTKKIKKIKFNNKKKTEKAKK